MRTTCLKGLGTGFGFGFCPFLLYLAGAISYLVCGTFGLLDAVFRMDDTALHIVVAVVDMTGAVFGSLGFSFGLGCAVFGQADDVLG